MNRCTEAETSTTGEPCEGWERGECTHRELAWPIRCARCWGTETRNQSGWCDACEWRSVAEKSTGGGRLTALAEHPSSASECPTGPAVPPRLRLVGCSPEDGQ